MKGHPSFCTMRLTNAAAALGRQELLLVSWPDTGYISILLLLASGYCFFHKTMCPIAVTPAVDGVENSVLWVIVANKYFVMKHFVPSASKTHSLRRCLLFCHQVVFDYSFFSFFSSFLGGEEWIKFKLNLNNFAEKNLTVSGGRSDLTTSLLIWDKNPLRFFHAHYLKMKKVHRDFFFSWS